MGLNRTGYDRRFASAAWMGLGRGRMLDAGRLDAVRRFALDRRHHGRRDAGKDGGRTYVERRTPVRPQQRLAGSGRLPDLDYCNALLVAGRLERAGKRDEQVRVGGGRLKEIAAVNKDFAVDNHLLLHVQTQLFVRHLDQHWISHVPS